MTQDKLEQLKALLPLMKESVADDLAITIWDKNGTALFCQRAESFPLYFEPGFTIPDPEDKIFLAMKTGKTIHNVLPREIFGIAIEGNLVPIFDHGEVIGCLTSVYSVEEKQALELKSQEMKEMLLGSKDSVEKIFSRASQSVEYLSLMHKFMQDLEQDVNKVLKVVSDIKRNTNSTKILSLNASIEAARAYEAGRGFNIVAREMSRLSENSAKSANEIESNLNAITASMSKVSTTLQELDDASEFDQGAIEQILSSLNSIVK